MNRRTRSKRSPWRILWNVFQLGVVCVAAVASGLLAYQFVREQEYLVVKGVTVDGVDKVTEAEILEYAQVPLGAPLYRVNLEAVERALMRHPDVATALVARVPPDRIVITVAEHVPVATVAVGQGVYVVNQEAKLFRRVQAGEDLDLPVITGLPKDLFAQDAPAAGVLVAEAVAALNAVHAAGRSMAGVSAVDMDEAVGVTLVLNEPAVEVVLGRGNLEEKLSRLAALEQQLVLTRQKASRVFLDNARHPERVAVQLVAAVVATADTAVQRKLNPAVRTGGGTE